MIRRAVTKVLFDVEWSPAFSYERDNPLSDDWQDYWSCHVKAEGRRLHGDVLGMIRRLRDPWQACTRFAYALVILGAGCCHPLIVDP